MAHVVLEHRLEEAGLADRVSVASAGTGDWHVGGPMDERAAATLQAADYDPTRHRARQVDASWFAAHDLLLAMDAANRADLQAMAPDEDVRRRVVLFRAFDPLAGPEDVVPDPYGGGPAGFEDVLATVERTVDALVPALAAHLRPSG